MRHRIFWGIAIILMGVIFLLASIFGFEAWGFLWPFFLIAAGAWILITRLAPVQDFDTQEYALPLEGASSAKIIMKHGAGVIQVSSLESKGDLLKGSFSGGVHPFVSREGDHIKVSLKSGVDFMQVFPRFSGGQGLDWNVAINKKTKVDLKMETGASDNRLDLTDLQVGELRLDTGASSTEMDLPKAAGFTKIKVNSGAASLLVRVPKKVAAKIFVQGLVSKDIDQNRFPRQGKYFQSPDYDDAANKVEIRVESGVGSLEVK